MTEQTQPATELGLSVAEAASRSGVSEQTWRNYEAGRTTVRGDKQPGVWDTLEWEIPEFPAGYGPDFLRLLPGLLAQGDMGDMGFADDGTARSYPDSWGSPPPAASRSAPTCSSGRWARTSTSCPRCPGARMWASCPTPPSSTASHGCG